MACIKLSHGNTIIEKVLTPEELNSINHDEGGWKEKDVIDGKIKDIMYYAWDVKKVLEQANGQIAIPTYIKVKAGELPATTMLALKKDGEENLESIDSYFPLVAAGWPMRYEQVDIEFGAGNVLDYQEGKMETSLLL